MAIKKFIIDSKFGIIDYMVMVESLVDGYYDNEGEYQPHVG